MQEMQQQAQQGAPADPRIEAAKITADAKKEEVAVKRETLAYNAERERAEAEQKMVDNQLKRELALAAMESDGQLSREEMSRREQLELLKIDDERQRFNAEVALKMRQGSGI